MLEKIRNTGFEISLNDGFLVVEPVEKLSSIQKKFIAVNQRQLITVCYVERSTELNMGQCNYCINNVGKSRCNGRKLVFNDTWLRCKSYKFSGSYHAVMDSQPLSEGLLPEYHHDHDKYWLMKKNLSLNQCETYSERFTQYGRQAANLKLLEY